MCSFWYVECLSRMGDLHKARFFFEKMLGYTNHLGLYDDELGQQAQHLGNFPQAFTHVAHQCRVRSRSAPVRRQARRLSPARLPQA
jgi:GH15 family glucan-1,4-alpha-glucosidase